METRDWLRSRIAGLLLGEHKLALKSEAFAPSRRFEGIDSLGLYLHVPFCRQICPYCPYNKELFHVALAERYTEAVLKEIDRYSAILGALPVTTFYIGGGTPTTMLHTGLPRILDHIYRRFNMQCGIHMESHPNDLSPANLNTIMAMGVEHLSMGIEALQDRHLRTLCRPYSAAEAQAVIAKAVEKGFECVNVDLIFALPDQTHEELELSARVLIELGVDQVAAYPLFSFPYTQWPQLAHQNHYRSYSLLQKRRMLQVLEQAFYAAGYARTSVWAFTKASSPKYCSVTVPLYLGLGASAGSYLRDIFYLNTFNTEAYIQALADGCMPIALSLELSERMQMAGWLYWRIYETRFSKDDFERRFHMHLDAVYGRYLRLLSFLGLLTEGEDEVVLTDAGAYWLHTIQDLFSIDYISKLWGTSQLTPWPAKIRL
ncbi:MAG: radical SAM protein [Anaerolineae bacterium]|jgi:oxygen-independent coproporphyrinogen-3 oxidase